MIATKEVEEQKSEIESLESQLDFANATIQSHIDREAGFLDQIKELKSEVQRQQDLNQKYSKEVQFYTKEYNKLAQEKKHQAGHADAKHTMTLKRRSETSKMT